MSTTEYPIFDCRRKAVVYANQHGLIPYELKDGTWSVKEPDWVAPTKQELREFVCAEKQKVSDGYIILVKDNTEYKFLLDSEKSQGKISLQIIDFYAKEETATVDWKVYSYGGVEETPTQITLTKTQFLSAFAFGKDMMQTAFDTENDFNIEITDMTEEERTDEEHITNFNARVTSSFGQIPKRFSLDTLQALPNTEE